MWWEIYISMYPIRALTWSISCTKGWGNISKKKEKNIIGGGLNTEAMGLENEDFSDEDHCQCMYTWEFLAYIFYGIRKNPTRKISTNQTPSWKFPTHVFKYSHPSFLGFFHHCYRYHWCYLKDCFAILCYKSVEVFMFVKICQNEVSSEERQLMK